MTKRYSVATILDEAEKVNAMHTNEVESDRWRLFTRWFCERMIEVLSPMREVATLGQEPYATMRYASDLDSFEFLGQMIPRAHIAVIAVMFLAQLDVADQCRFVCQECKHQHGFFVERGFERCNKCGYPGQ